MAARGRGRDRRSREAARSLSRVDACNPLLQAHPTWARDEHEGRGISTSLTPVSGHLTSPLRARPRVDPSGLGHAATFTRRLRDPPVSKRRQAMICHTNNKMKGYLLVLNVSNCYEVLPPFLFSCRWIVQFCTIQRQLKRNRGSIRACTVVFNVEALKVF